METHQEVFFSLLQPLADKDLITSLEVSLRLVGGAPADPSVAQCCFVTTVSPV